MKKIVLFFLFLLSFPLIRAQVPSYIPTSNLVGWWPFNNNANDESGNGNNGALQNGVVTTSDRFGNTNAAYSFDGLNDRIFINTACISYLNTLKLNQQTDYVIILFS